MTHAVRGAVVNGPSSERTVRALMATPRCRNWFSTVSLTLKGRNA
jgi:hypothetical protein